MPTEVTATMMIGPVVEDSHHGQPAGRLTDKLFCPSHSLNLMEGSRAVWILHCFPALRRPCPTRRILPSSPKHLLAAAVLGYTAFVIPRVITQSDTLRPAVFPGPCAKSRRTVIIDDDLAASVFAECGPHVYGMLTVMPGSTIGADELRAGSAAGLQIAVPETCSR